MPDTIQNRRAHNPEVAGSNPARATGENAGQEGCPSGTLFSLLVSENPEVRRLPAADESPGRGRAEVPSDLLSRKPSSRHGNGKGHPGRSSVAGQGPRALRQGPRLDLVSKLCPNSRDEVLGVPAVTLGETESAPFIRRLVRAPGPSGHRRPRFTSDGGATRGWEATSGGSGLRPGGRRRGPTLQTRSATARHSARSTRRVRPGRDPPG
jgi:hypothetical protein